MFETVSEVLKKNGFSVRCFSTAAEAAAYLDQQIDSKTVGIGGSHTVQDMGLYPMLDRHNIVYFNASRKHSAPERNAIWAASQSAQVYITGANALAEATGEIINIDAFGNRLAASLYGHEIVYFVIGRNKLAPDFQQALWRARNVAAPKNCQALGKHTPCAQKADRCYDCSSPDRLCNGLAVLWRCMSGSPMEVVLIDEDLGY